MSRILRPSFALILLLPALRGQSWSNVTVAGGQALPARLWCGFVTDGLFSTKSTLFGGMDTLSRLLGDTWSFDGPSATWTQVSTVGPGPRRNAVFVRDETRQQLILLGGRQGAILQDMWAYHPVAQVWSFVASTTPLGPRAGACAVDRHWSGQTDVILFGGEDSAGPMNDTWRWDGVSWTPLGVGPNSPSARAEHAMSFDPFRGEAILFGGRALNMMLGDTWSLRGNTWTQVSSSTSPAARHDASMTYDLQRQCHVLRGGHLDYYSPTLLATDTWELAGSWCRRTNAASSLSAAGMDMVFDGTPTGMKATTFGGISASTILSRMQAWDSHGGTIANLAGGCVPALELLCLAPNLGCRFSASLVGVPTGTLHAIVLGFSTAQTVGGVPLPLNLNAGTAFPVCNLLVRDDQVHLRLSPAGFESDIPNDPSLDGLTFFLQGGLQDATTGEFRMTSSYSVVLH